MSKKKNYAKGFWSLPVHEVDFSKEKIVSYSQFSNYLICPKRWELTSIRKLSKFTDNINTVFGTAMHNTIQNFLTVMYNKTRKAAMEIDINTYLMSEMKLITKDLIKKYSDKNEKLDITSSELSEYYGDGISILSEFRKKITQYFDLKDELIAIELPLVHKIPNIDNLYFTAYIDTVIYSPRTKRYLILDYKTSTKGWNDYNKKDKTKTAQLLLYKKYLSEIHDIPIELIDVKYLILKRKVNEDAMYSVMKQRIQHFSPTSGKLSIKKLMDEFDKFISDCFNPDGSYNVNRNYIANSGKDNWNCKFCDFKDSEHCPITRRIN